MDKLYTLHGMTANDVKAQGQRMYYRTHSRIIKRVAIVFYVVAAIMVLSAITRSNIQFYCAFGFMLVLMVLAAFFSWRATKAGQEFLNAQDKESNGN